MPLLTLEELKKQVKKWWSKGVLHKAHLTGEALFPLRFPLPRLSAQQLQAYFTALRPQIKALVANSKTQQAWGYTIEYGMSQHRRLGEQKVPVAVIFATQEDLLRWLGCYGAFQQFCTAVATTRDILPILLPLITAKPKLLIDNTMIWPQLLTVCRYFTNHPNPNVYLRELDIPGIDTKFIESHPKILKTLLDHILPPILLIDKPNTLAQHGFERRFNLRYPEPMIRFRLLDRQLEALELPATDITLPLSQFAQLKIPCQKVFITENLINGLSFPDHKAAIVIFGFGYGILSLANIAWLTTKNLFYWGDIDSHGFAILSRLRQHFPHLKSFLMDQDTWSQFPKLRVQEPQHQRHLLPLAHLTLEEQQLYTHLCRLNNTTPNRLEQERLPFSYCRTHIENTH